MTNALAHEYVHSTSIGNIDNCRITIQKTKAMIKPFYDTNQLMGYHLLLIENEADITEKWIPDNFEEITNGQFPFVYAFVQPAENNPIDYDQLMKSLGYIRVDV